MTSIGIKPSTAPFGDISVTLLFWAYTLAVMIGPIAASPGMSPEIFGSRGFLKRGSGDSAATRNADFHAHSLADNTTSASLRQLQSQQLLAKRFPSDVMTCIAGKPVLKTHSMDTTKYDVVSASVTKLYHRLPKHCNTTSCPQADWAGCVLRASGHDFMDFDPIHSLGGSDGCIDFDDADNKGLDKCLYMGEFHTSLLEAYQEHCLEVSLADFFVISAEAILSAMRPTNAPSIDFRSRFRYGRVTATHCTNLPALPDAEKGCGAVEQTFVKQMGLTWRDSAALMGVHTIGRAQKNNSGYNGWWSDPENSRIFNNNYYASLIAKGWRSGKPFSDHQYRHYKHLFPDTSPGKVQWVRFDHWGWPGEAHRHEMMLNTDMCLVYANHRRAGHQPVLASRDDCCAWVPVKSGSRNAPMFDDYKFKKEISANSDGTYCGSSVDHWRSQFANRNHQACCGGAPWPFYDNCGHSKNGEPWKLGGRAESDVFEFAASESAWLGAFLPAWTKATENGQEESLRPLRRLDVSTTVTTTTATAPTSTTGTNANCHAWVYQHGDFTGWRASFPIGDYNLDRFVARGAKSNDASSIMVVGSGCNAILYEHADFTGWQASFDTGSYDFDSFVVHGARNDEASSLRVVQKLMSTTSLAPERTTTTTSAPHGIMSGDVVFLKARSGSGNVVDVEGVAVRARWKDRGTWQALSIEKADGGEVLSGDVVYLKGHTGAYVDVAEGVVQARWDDKGAWQAMTIEKKIGSGPILPDDVICLKAHTLKYLDVEDEFVQARWNECGDWQQMVIEQEASDSLFSGGAVHLLAHTGNRVEVEGVAVQARWSEAGLWQTFTIQNYGGRAIYSGDTIFLKSHTSKLLHVEGVSVAAKWDDYGAWQAFVVERKGGNGALMPGDSIFLQAHTGWYVGVHDVAVKASWFDKGDWQTFTVEKAMTRRLTAKVVEDQHPVGVNRTEERSNLNLV